MGKLVVTEFITLDGVIEDPGGAEQTEHGGWTFRFDQGPDAVKFKLDELLASDAQLLGRVTYEGFARAWPGLKGTGEFGARMNEMPKFVVSTSLRDPAWANTAVIDGDLSECVRALKEQFAGDILVAGSATLVQGLLERDLVDELNLMVFPVVLGSGKRLFADDAERRRFALYATHHTGSVVIMKLRRERHQRRAVDIRDD